MENNSDLKYMVIGAGGTGGAVGSYLAHSGKDVTFIARGRHLEAMKASGLRVIRPHDEFTINNFRAFSTEEYLQSCGDLRAPDVIFVCVKGYSVEDTIPFIRNAASADTLVIPILNLYGTGAKMQSRLPDIMVTDGCIYVASEIKSPGVILMNGEILRVVFGLRSDNLGKSDEYRALFEKIHKDLTEAGIDCVVSDNIERDALRKFSYVSPQGACGLYYGVPAGPMQHPGAERDCFAGLVAEIQLLAEAMGIDFGEDIVAANLSILDDLSPTMTTSLQRDISAGRSSEIDGLIYEVVRMAERHGIDLPMYRRISSELGMSF